MEAGDNATANKLIERLSKLTALSPSVIIANLQAETARAKLAANQPYYMRNLAGAGGGADLISQADSIVNP
jgi:hypothetical protein